MFEYAQDYYDSHWAEDSGPASPRNGKKKRKQPALTVAPIHGVLPYAGARNPLTRSNTARRVSFTVPTPATEGMPQLYHFESEAEFSVGLEALLDPELFGLEVQLPAISYLCRRARRLREHYFDLRLTFRDGHRRAVFVRNGWSFWKPQTQDEIEDIFAAIPAEFADDAIVVNADDYTRAYRDNLRRAWHLNCISDAEVDAYVESVARTTNFWLLKDLVEQCDLPSPDAWQSAVRLINRHILEADWYAVINLYSRVWLAA